MKIAAVALTLGSAVASVPILRGHNVHDADVIPGSYMGVFEKGPSASSALTKGVELLKQQGAEVTYEYDIQGDFVGFAAKLDEAQLDFAANQIPGLAYLEVDSLAYALQSNPSCSSTQSGATWGIARSDGNRGSTSSYSHNTAGGRGVEVYIMDTGIACSAQSSQYNNCRHGFCASGLSNCNNDGNGHGTHVAGTSASSTYGIAKGADLVNVKVLSDAGSGAFSGIVAGVNYAAGNHNGRGVSNMSLGGGANASLDSAINSAHNSGNLLNVVAAGNGGAANGACNGSPSRANRAFSIGSTTSSNARSSFSDQGSCMNLFAPGSSILSTSRTGGTATMSGTSMASPHVAGAGALLRGNSGSNAESIWDALIRNSDSNVVSGVNQQTPNRFINTC